MFFSRVIIGRRAAIVACLALLTAVMWKTVEQTQPLLPPAIFDDSLRKEIAARNPRFVFVGNSILQTSIDRSVLDAALEGEKTMMVSRQGSMAAMWYLWLKNSILPAKNGPMTIMIFFRDDDLTQARRGTVEPQVVETLRGMRTREEPVFDALMRWSAGEKIRIAFGSVLRTHAAGERFREAVRSSIARMLTHDASAAVALMLQARQRLDYRNWKEIPTQRIVLHSALEEQPFDDSIETSWDAAEAIQRSFLPHMIAEADGAQARLVFVRMKRRPNALGVREQDPRLVRYIEHLREYIASTGHGWHDFTADPRITEDKYGEGDHIVDAPWFTELFLSALTLESQ